MSADVKRMEVIMEVINGLTDSRRQTSTPPAPAFTTFADFTPGKHLQCPACGFEAIYTDARRRTVSYVMSDGLTIDAATTERDSTVKHSDVSGISCNRSGCDWTGPALLPAGYVAAVGRETEYYHSQVRRSDAYAVSVHPVAVNECRRSMILAADVLARLQSWAADPAGYDFSDVCEVAL